MDVVQSVCRDLLQAHGNLDFASEASFRGYLFTAALNKIRAKSRFHDAGVRDVDQQDPLPADTAAEELLGQQLAGLPSASRDAVAAERLAAIDDALAALPEDHREVICLARLADLPHAEIARVLGRSVGAVRQLLGRALVKLGVELERRGVTRA